MINFMKTSSRDRNNLIKLAIGTAVNELIASGLPVSRENILYELEKMKANSADFYTRSITLEAAQRLRNQSKQNGHE